MSTATNLLTFEEFERLPDPPSGHYELHHGELVTVPPPQWDHWSIQDHISDLLKDALRERGRAGVEVPFRVLPENEFRIADVAFISAERLQRLQGPYFEGAPDLVVEVLSPSNTASEILDRESLCLRNGARAFWQVDPQNRLIKVTTADGRSAIFGIGGEIPLEEFGGGKIAVSDVFADLK